MASRTSSARTLPIADSATSTATRIVQLNGKRTLRNSVGAIAEMVIAHIELMIDEKRNPTPMISSALRHGVCRVTPLKAKPTVNAAAALIAAMRAQNLRLQIMPVLMSILGSGRRQRHLDQTRHLHRGRREA